MKTHKLFALGLLIDLALITSAKAECPQGETLGTDNVCYPASGTCGKSCLWNYDSETHRLTISGDGNMTDYDGYYREDLKRYQTSAPWKYFDDNVYAVSIEGNLKNIGSHTVYNLNNLQDLKITAPVETIGFQSLHSTSRLADGFKLPETVTTIADQGLYDFKGQDDRIIIPDSVETIGRLGLRQVQVSKIFLGNGVQSIGENAFWGISRDLVVYCENTTAGRCANLIAQNNSDSMAKLKAYTKIHTLNGDRYIFGDTWYKSISDFENNKPVKKIYTIEEAMEATKNGTKFHVGLTYK